MDRTAVARSLLWIAVAMVAGFISLGTLAERLARVGISALATAVTGISIFMIIQTVIILGLSDRHMLLWICFGFFGTSNILTYASLSQSFPAYLSCRVTTGVNLLVFIAAFAGQWAIGAIIGIWPVGENGSYALPGYQTGFAAMLGIQVLSLIWFFIVSIRT